MCLVGGGEAAFTSHSMVIIIVVVDKPSPQIDKITNSAAASTLIFALV